MRTLVTLLRRRPHFRRLWLGEVVSLLGDWMSFVAISLLALRGGDGVIPLALVLVAHVLPHALLAPIAGTLADRLDRRRLMITANVVEAALTAGMAIAAAAGSVGLVQILVFARSSVGAFLPPVQSAAMRRVVDSDELLAANTISSITWSVMFAVGMAIGGAIAALGPTLALVLDAASFAIAALLLRGLPAMTVEQRLEKEGLLAALIAVRRDMSAAWKHARTRPALLDAVLSKTPLGLAGGGAWVLLNLVSDDVKIAGSGALALGLLQCVRGAGTGVGPALSSWLINRGMSMSRAANLAAYTAFTGIALFSVARAWPLLLLAVLTWGAGTGSNWVLTTSEIQRLSPDRFVGRLSAIDGLAFTVGMCITAVLGATLVDGTGVSAATAWLGLAAGILGWIGLRWALSTQSRAPAEDAIGFAP